MRAIWLAVLALVVQVAPVPPWAGSVTMTFAREIEPGTCQIQYMTQTRPGRIGDTLRDAPHGDGMYTFTPRGGALGIGLRAVVDCRGYGVALIDVTLSAGVVPVKVAPVKLKTVSLHGRIVNSNSVGNPLAGFEVEASQGQSSVEWRTCVYLLNPATNSAIDCLTFLGGPLVAIGTLRADGGFDIDLPDLAHDPGLLPMFTETLELTLRHPGTSESIFRLRQVPADPKVPMFEVAARATYPDPMTFEVVAR